MSFEIERSSEYENGFYLTASIERVSKFACHLDLFRRSSGIAGEIVECGVFKGASLSRFVKLRALLENPSSRRIVAFDTFDAMPEPGEEDREKLAAFQSVAGQRGLGRETLLDLLSQHRLETNLELVAGDIRETVPAYCRRHPELRISLLNVDVDLYEPTLVCLEQLYPRVAPGGIVLLDDYGAFPGASRAIDAFFADSGLKIQKLPYAYSVAFVEKP